jgi:hypothetical protein
VGHTVQQAYFQRSLNVTKTSPFIFSDKDGKACIQNHCKRSIPFLCLWQTVTLMEKWIGHKNLFSSIFTAPVEMSFECANCIKCKTVMKMEMAFRFCKLLQCEVSWKAIQIGSGVVNRPGAGLWGRQISGNTYRLLGAFYMEGMPPRGFFLVI